MIELTAVELLNLGYTPVSVVPPGAIVSENSKLKAKEEELGKVPGVKGSNDEWYGLLGWRIYKPTIEDAIKWDKSGANIGILATNAPAFDIDIDDAELSKKIELELLRVCGPAPMRTSKPPRSLLIYRIDEPLKKQKLEFTYEGIGHAVEFLCNGQQFIVAGTHPQGHPYSVNNIIPQKDLICLTPQLIQNAFQAIISVVESAGGKITKLPDNGAAQEGDKADLLALLGPHKVDYSHEEIQRIVNGLDPDTDYDSWLKIGMALHAQYNGSETGLQIWDTWSRRGKKYKPGECEMKWRSFRSEAGGVSFSSVIQMAQEEQSVSKPSASVSLSHSILIPSRIIRKPKSVADLMKKQFKPRQFVIDKLLPEGCFLLVAHPKTGKSWLALQLCLSVSTGSEMFGRKVTKGKALYLALEDDELRLQDRLRKLNVEDHGDVNLLTYQTEWSKDNAGGAEDLETWLKDNPETKIIVIDTLEKFRVPRKHNANGYGEDYNVFNNLRKLSQNYRVAILLIHHLKKGSSNSDDLLEGISGTMGLSAAADGALLLSRIRGENTAKLQFIGRDIAEEKALAVTFNRDSCLWTCEGYADHVFIADSKQKVIDAIKSLGGSAKISDIQPETGLNGSTLRGVLRSLVRDELLIPKGRGLYALPDGHDPLDELDEPIVIDPSIKQHNKQTFQQEIGM